MRAVPNFDEVEHSGFSFCLSAERAAVNEFAFK